MEALIRAQHEGTLHVVSQRAQLGVAEHVVAQREDALDGAAEEGARREKDAGEAAPHRELGGVGAPEE